MTRHQLIVLLPALLAANIAHADKLIFAFEPGSSDPYTIIQGNELKGGLMKTLGDALALAAGLTPSYYMTSRARIEKDTETGLAHINCLTSPIWFKNPQAVRWSIPVIQEEERYLIHKDAPDIINLTDLDTLRVGMMKSYRYPTLEAAIAQGRFQRDDSNSVQQAYRKLIIGRIDALLAKDIQITHLLKNDPGRQAYRLATRVESRNQLQCAISRQLPFEATRLEHAFQKLKQSGLLEQLATQYQPHPSASQHESSKQP
ncbi:ABC-type amino acid transport substrate-binding protein [Chitinivorax tropicus]|uniref:ABC-type amino acid transport substrate-binding protein n=1 Tax=Chitinivorax tropicus TaxID=714531 RepID=A0A840MRL6_9PROT|nr:transporter substrate-binding domain-containing protein [Chitinivorax tropicus]MBB5017861.1 ABC-type amino acid transport substrate-binding protein [Chitinivorax tropicus]